MSNKLKIGIISLGLIGGSILKSLRNFDYDFICVTRNDETIDKLNKMGINATVEYEKLKECNVVFICSPMRCVLDILDELENILSETTIVLDVSSLKSFVSKKQRPYIFIPSHPMAGKETFGFDVADENLFKRAKWVLTPFENTDEKNIQIVKDLISKMGAEIVITTAEEHDRAVALISHMPLVLSQALVKMVEDNNLAKKLASSGFRDMTRLALSNFVMAQDMVELNGENILKSVQLLENNLKNLINDYKEDEVDKIKQIRNQIYSIDGKNIF